MDLVRFRYGENNINTGPLKEIPEICIDHFFGSDLNSSVFFLTHAHTDHLVGLETEEFLRRLRQPGIKLYCHLITPILLGSFNRYLKGPDGIRKLIADKKIVPLDVEKPMRICIPRISGHLDVTVTLLPAGHCPGSIMLMFEMQTMRILHTGDFRLGIDDLQRMPLLHSNKLPKQIHHLYIDTTFCCKSATLFPDRKKVLKQAFDEIKEWISLSNQHIINFSFSAKFAHEYVLLEINRVFSQKIHVTPERLEIYKHIPDILKIATLDNQTQFHLCGDRNCLDNVKIMTVRLSAIWYTRTKEAHRDSLISWRGRHNMTLCYSMHSSLDEIGKTIDYLKPRIVTPLVRPVGTDISQIYSAIRSVTNSPFEFEDYRSSRNVFEGIELPATPCVEERDETDVMDVDVENPLNEDDIVASTSHEEEDVPVKQFKLSDEEKLAWKFKFSPSPSSKNSQSSSDDGSQSASDGSQDMKSQNVTDDFAKPSLPLGKLNPRRRLDLTDFRTNETDFSALMSESSMSCEEYDVGDGDNPLVNSQRL